MCVRTRGPSGFDLGISFVAMVRKEFLLSHFLLEEAVSISLRSETLLMC